VAVKSSAGLCKELGIDVGEVYSEKLTNFLEQAEEKAYFEGGNW